MLGMFLSQVKVENVAGGFLVLFPCENTLNMAGHQQATWIPKESTGTKISLVPPASPSIAVPLRLSSYSLLGTEQGELLLFPNSV